MEPLIFEERWKYITEKSVPDIVENMYIVSDTGRVKNIKTNKELTLVETNNGYYRVNLRLRNKTSRYYLIHRIVAIEFMPVDDYKNLQINHFDGNKANNNIWNFEWVTCSQNIQHAFDHKLKTQYHGEDCSWSTINNEQAEQIAIMITQQKYTQREIANIIGCTKSVVADIAQGQNWKYLYDKYNLEQFKKEFIINFSDDELHILFKYFEDHKNYYYKYKNDLYREALINCFGIQYNYSMSATMSRLYGRKTRTEISDQYDF